jgi:AhpC/TSA family protein
MTNRSILSRTLAAALLALAATAGADGPARVGAPAPDFTATDTHGQTRHLSEFKGKPVVLEWLNPGCPFVQKHYGSGNMQRLQKAVTGDGAVWLSVVSSAPGKQGYMTPAEADGFVRDKAASPTAVLLDPKGEVARLYAAKTTPHMFLIDAKGTLVYAGAIDDKPTTDPADVASANNYVLAAYHEVKDGKAVTTASTAPYGCSVKYETP